MHHHISKTEDIINRGGGNLMIQLFNNTEEEKLDNTKVKVSIDGEKLVLEPGTTIKLIPGESITLTKEVYHKFWAEEGHGKVLVGEVSSVNDDRTDNVFLENKGRFDEIDEDVEPLYLLYDDYKKFLSLG
jgi:D-lyxose ketol-isomerase